MMPNLVPGDYTDGPVDFLTPQVSVQFIAGGRILSVWFSSPADGAYDRWEAWMRNLLDQWPLTRRLCILYDLRDPRFGHTLEGGTKLRRLIADFHHLHIYTALVVDGKRDRNRTASLLLGVRLYGGHVRALFTDPESARAWLLDYCADDVRTRHELLIHTRLMR